MTMPTWNEICAGVDRMTKKINESVEIAADRAALQFKLSSCRGNLDKEYRELGRLMYDKLCPSVQNEQQEDASAQKMTEETTTTAETPDDLTAQINSALARITALRAEISALEKKVK